MRGVIERPLGSTITPRCAKIRMAMVLLILPLLSRYGCWRAEGCEHTRHVINNKRQQELDNFTRINHPCLSEEHLSSPSTRTCTECKPAVNRVMAWLTLMVTGPPATSRFRAASPGKSKEGTPPALQFRKKLQVESCKLAWPQGWAQQHECFPTLPRQYAASLSTRSGWTTEE